MQYIYNKQYILAIVNIIIGAAVAQEVKQVCHYLSQRIVVRSKDPTAACSSHLGQDTEPQIAPDVFFIGV